MKLVLKRSILFPIVSALLICFALLTYYSKYSIDGSNGSIEDYLSKKSHTIYENSSVQEQIDIDNTKIVLFKFDEDSLKYALFNKGLNGKYKIKYLSSINDRPYISFIEKIHNNYYLISLGYNAQNNSYIDTTLSSEYNISDFQNEAFEIMNEEYFIKYKIIDEQYASNFSIHEYSLEN